MKKYTVVLLSLIALAGMTVSRAADAPAPKPVMPAATVEQLNAVADAYITAYCAHDYAKLKEFYSEDAEFYDPTTEGKYGSPIKWVSRERILRIMPGAFAVVENWTFDIKYRVAYHDRVVLHGVMHMKLKNPPGSAAEYSQVEVPATTMLTVRRGKVVQHTDLIDYSTMP